MTLTERLVRRWKLVKRKRTGVENREHTFKEDVAENRIKVGMVKIRSKIGDKFSFLVMARGVITM